MKRLTGKIIGLILIIWSSSLAIGQTRFTKHVVDANVPGIKALIICDLDFDGEVDIIAGAGIFLVKVSSSQELFHERVVLIN